MKRRQILAVGAFTATATLAAGGAASAAPSGTKKTPPGLATKDNLAWAAGSTMKIGTAVAGGGHYDDDPNSQPTSEEALYAEVLNREFSSVSAENQMKWEYLHPERDTYAFEDGDAIMASAQQHGQVVRGHTLFWHSQNPAWLEEGTFSADELRAILKDHIDTVVGHYRGHIQQWDVANEIFTEEGELRENNIWIRELGPGIIADAFRWARAADPDALLFFNDYNVDGINPKSDGYYALIQELLADGVPVDGFATQGHLSTRYGFPADLAENLQRFADLGLETAITELDVRMDLPESGVPTAEQLEVQAEYYRRVTEAAVAVDGCNSLTLWGFADSYSWVPATFPGEGAATVMWEDFTRKPAYYAVQDALAEGSGRADHPALKR